MIPPPRADGGLEAVHAGLPPPVVDLFAGLTLLGSTAVLVGLALAVYWGVDRRDGAVLLGIVLGAIGLTLGLKALFGLPRPPPGLWRIETTGFGFPSGHALGAAATWGGLARLLEAGTRRRRWAVAAVVIGVVALSRVVLGVHYPVDVLVGAAVGAGYLAVVTRARSPDPGVALGSAVLVGIGAVAATGGAADALVVLGAGLGAATAWKRLAVPRRPWGWVGVGLPLAIGAIAAAAGLDVDPGLARPVALGGGAVLGAAAIALPSAGERVRSAFG